MNRRDLMRAGAVSLAAAAAPLPLRKGLVYGMLPRQMSLLERFQTARAVGFEEVECYTTPEEREAEEIKKAAETAGLRIHSVMNSDHWRFPLSSSDPEVVAKSVRGMETSLRNAHLWGAETVLLVPAVVNPETRYEEAWKRSAEQIRRLLPLAEKLKVVIAVENVWNKFLLSPMEFARYVDQFKSRWLQAYFDVGNVVLFGYPQDWIRTLGKRVVKVHLKDFRFRPDPATKKRVADFVPLLEGDVDWKQVRAALGEIGYQGSATVELPGGDREYLAEVSRRVDQILQGS